MIQPGNQTLLVVDDDEEMRTLLCEFLAETASEIETASDGKEALELFDDVRPALLVVDLVMPRMDGLELITALRERGSDIPIVALTGLDAQAVGAEALRCGADDFVRKPFIAAEVVARVTNLLVARETTLELEAARQDAEQAHEELARFVYAASHDLKSPIRGVRNLVSWLEDEAYELLGERQQEYLRLLRGKSDVMHRLVTRLTQYSRVIYASGTQIVNVGALTTSILTELDPPESFTVELDQQMPTFKTSEMLLRYVLFHLLDNAIAHHDRPDGILRIAVRETDDDVWFTISDDGPGIPSDERHRIFEPFESLSERGSHAGLGLAIVERCIHTVGGDLELTTSAEGTSFHVRWPRIEKNEDFARARHLT